MTTGAQQIWETSLGHLQLQVPRPSYETWFKGTSGLTLEGDLLTVSVPTPFAAEWLERRMYQLIQRTVTEVATHPLQVYFQIVSPTQRAHRADATEAESPVSPRLPLNNGTPHVTDNGSSRNAVFNRRYTFDNFVIGKSNQLAYAAATAVAEHPGVQYNPLFIYSGVGLGKTHLLHAIASAVAQRNLGALYVTTEQFTNEFIQAIRERKTEDFRAKYRSTDVLLVDDIQFLAGKEQTQEGFFHTFNDLHNTNRQIVVTCDRTPNAVALLEDRLRSRFEWGLIADIQPPPQETRLAILQDKAHAQGITLSAQVAQAIAHRASHSIRELEGYLTRVIAMSQFLDTPITVDLVDMALVAVAPAQPTVDITPDEVIHQVATYYRLSSQTLCTRPRNRKTTLPQRIAMFLLAERLHQPPDTVATLLGNWHRKTVSNALRQTSQQLQHDADLQHQVAQISQALGLGPA